MTDLVPALLGSPRFLIEPARTRTDYHRLRRRVFVDEQKLFAASDLDDRDDDPRTIVLEARDPSGALLGGVRLGPAIDGADIGWWQGGRLVVDPAVRGAQRIGPALVRAACAAAEQAGALRFDATVQARFRRMFERLGWEPARPVTVAGKPHHLMRWPIGRIAALAAATKNPLGGLLDGLNPGGAGFVGDDGAPVPGTDLIAACDAILPSMVERDPDWAGWCAVLVNVNDLAAMGATPVGLLNAIGARDAAHAARIIGGLRRAADAYGIPILGGHTQLGVPASLSATALGRTPGPVPTSDKTLDDRARPAAGLAPGGDKNPDAHVGLTSDQVPGGEEHPSDRVRITADQAPGSHEHPSNRVGLIADQAHRSHEHPSDHARLTADQAHRSHEHPSDHVPLTADQTPSGHEHPSDRMRVTAGPVPGGGGRPGDRVRLTADLGGGWRPGYHGRQWDSTSRRTSDELRQMQRYVAAAQPAAAKDVSMAGIVGTLGMLAEASGCGAVLDVAAVPRPAAATMGDWLTCFPGFAMLTTGPQAEAPAGPAVTAVCGELVADVGVRLRWPDGEITTVLTSGVTGMGAAA